MLSLSTIVSAAVALTSVGVYANPVARSTCSPNAQGAGVSIVSVANAGLEWGDANTTPVDGDVLTAISSGGLPNFHVSQSGQFPTSYIIKDVNNNELAVTSSGNELVFNPASNTGTQENQLFDIVCQTCGLNTTPGEAAGSFCTVSPQGYTNACIQIGDATSPLDIVTCDSSGTQLFSIVF